MDWAWQGRYYEHVYDCFTRHCTGFPFFVGFVEMEAGIMGALKRQDSYYLIAMMRVRTRTPHLMPVIACHF